MNQSMRAFFFSIGALLLLCRPANAQEQPPAEDTQAQTDSSSRDVPPASEVWHFAVSPYLWFAGTHGTVGALFHNTSVHASAGDLLSHLNVGAMGAAEANYKRLVLSGDLVWVRISDSKALPAVGLGALSADVRLGQFFWTSKVGYRLVDQEKFKIDATTGVRYWHLGSKLSFNPSRLGLNSSGSKDWVDPLVGGRIQTPLSKKVELNVVGDVGGWGTGSQLEYQVAGLLGYKLCPKWTVQAGYRYLDVNYRNRGFTFDTATSGVLFGTTINLK